MPRLLLVYHQKHEKKFSANCALDPELVIPSYNVVYEQRKLCVLFCAHLEDNN